jgi:long-chain fatty acid transport protein
MPVSRARGIMPRMLREPRFALLVPACLLAVLTAAPVAHATSTMEIIGATTGGHQITARVLSLGSATTYFNPSLLPEVTPKLEAGFFGLSLQGRIRLQARPDLVDVPDSIYGTSSPGRYLATKDLASPRSNSNDDNSVIYAAIGMVRPLAGKALVFGLHAFMPVRGFLDQRGFFVDEREQYFSNRLHFELFGDRINVSSISFALGSQLSDWISLGAGIDIAILTESRVTVFVPDGADQSRAIFAPDIHTDSKFKPYFAATVHPNARSSAVATVHLPFANDTHGQNDLRFWNYTYPPGTDSVRQIYMISQSNEPLRVGIGGSYCGPRLPDGRAPWEFGLQLLWQRWSQYRNRQGERPLDAWRSTIGYAVGGGFLWRERHVTADLGFVPSPVPSQTGRTNYVDNSRLVMSLGIEGPVKFFGRELEAGITLFGSYFLPRQVSKDPYAAHPVVDELPDNAVDLRTGLPAAGAAGLQTNNPGYPGWKSSGYMVGAGATFRIAR